MKFWDIVGEPRTFQRLCPIVYVTFRLEDSPLNLEVTEEPNKC